MSRLPLLPELQPHQVVDQLSRTHSVHGGAEAKDKLALGSPLFLADVFLFDSPLCFPCSVPNKVQSSLRVSLTEYASGGMHSGTAVPATLFLPG